MKNNLGPIQSAPLALAWPRGLFIVFFLGVIFCSGCAQKRSACVTLAGSTSVQPMAELLAEHYMAAHPGVIINVQGGGSTAGVEAALSGAADIGMASRELKPEEKGLQPILIAYDAIAIIVHPSNPVRALTSTQVREIFAGQVRDWQELGGRPGRITCITREEGSGTRAAFEELIMQHKAEISPEAIVQDSTGAARAIVAGDPNGIAYISLGMATPEVAVVSLDGVQPTFDFVCQGRYKLTRPFLFLTKGSGSPLARAFIDYVLSPAGQALIAEEGYIPVRHEERR